MGRNAVVFPLIGVFVFAAVAAGCAVVDTGAFARLQDDGGVEEGDGGAQDGAPARTPWPRRRAPTRARSSLCGRARGHEQRFRPGEDRSVGRHHADGRGAGRDAADHQPAERAGAGAAGRSVGTPIGSRRSRSAWPRSRSGSRSSAAAPVPAAVPAPESAPEWKSPEEMYEVAVGQVKGGNPKKGRETLSAFAAKHPDHSFLPNALYWKGEAFYAEKDFENAILSFQDVVDKYPGEDKASDAMYKQGLSFLSLNDNKNARVLLGFVSNEVPEVEGCRDGEEETRRSGRSLPVRVLGIESSLRRDRRRRLRRLRGAALQRRFVPGRGPRRLRRRGSQLASREHLKSIVPVVEKALFDASTGRDAIDGIAVTAGPGLIGSLLVGLCFAKSLAFAWGNRSTARITLKRTSTPSSSRATFPFPTSRCWCPAATRPCSASKDGEMNFLGGTRDDAAGEAFDKAAKMMGLPYPGGVAVDRVGREGDAARFHFPRAWLSRDSADFSFSGLKTALRTFLASPEGKAARKEDVAASFQEAVADVLVGKAIEAAERERVPRLVLAGGVSANSRLRELASFGAPRRGSRRSSLRRRCAPTTRRWWRCSASAVSRRGSSRTGTERLCRFPVHPLSTRGGPSPRSACPPQVARAELPRRPERRRQDRHLGALIPAAVPRDRPRARSADVVSRGGGSARRRGRAGSRPGGAPAGPVRRRFRGDHGGGFPRRPDAGVATAVPRGGNGSRKPPVLRFLSHRPAVDRTAGPVPRAVLMLQREVVDRLCAGPGGRVRDPLGLPRRPRGGAQGVRRAPHLFPSLPGRRLRGDVGPLRRRNSRGAGRGAADGRPRRLRASEEDAAQRPVPFLPGDRRNGATCSWPPGSIPPAGPRRYPRIVPRPGAGVRRNVVENPVARAYN